MSLGVYNQVLAETVLLAGFVIVAALATGRSTNWKWVGIAIAFFAAQKAVVFLGVAGVLPDLVPGRLNWEGKLLSLVAVLVFGLLVFGDARDEWGLTLSQNGDAPVPGLAVAALTALAGAMLALFYFGGVRSGPANEWLYQLTMPAIEEELVYRGVLLLILDRAFAPRWKVAGVRLGYGAIVLTLMFYMTHVMRVDADWNIAVVWGDFLPGVYGLLWMYVRLATGSLALPIVLHGWANVVGFLM